MSAVLVDSSVLLDVLTVDAEWGERSAAALAAAADGAALVVDPIIYAEVSVRFSSVEELEAALPSAVFRREPLPWEAAFLAGKVFLSYRGAGGARSAPLPDFFIAAHAAVAGHRLLTRDPRRVRRYFPTVELLEV
jgi:predicted nucleic acid-binding protein